MIRAGSVDRAYVPLEIAEVTYYESQVSNVTDCGTRCPDFVVVSLDALTWSELRLAEWVMS